MERSHKRLRRLLYEALQLNKQYNDAILQQDVRVSGPPTAEQASLALKITGIIDRKWQIEDERADETIIYSNAWNLQFFAVFYNRLPRELRDMVYKQLPAEVMGGDRIHQETLQWSIAKGECTCTCSWSNTMTKSQPVPGSDSSCKDYITRARSSEKSSFSQMSERYGPEVTQELMEVFYQLTQFRLPCLCDIPSFLAIDFRNTGLIPKDLIRSVEVSCLRPPYKREDFIKIGEQLEMFLTVKHRAGFLLDLYFDLTCFGFHNQPTKIDSRILEGMAPVVYKLRNAGLNVRLRYRTTEFCGAGGCMDEIGTIMHHIMRFYEVPEKVWLERSANQSVFEDGFKWDETKEWEAEWLSHENLMEYE